MRLHRAYLLIEVATQADLEVRVLGPGAVVGEVQRLLGAGIQVDNARLPASFARVQEHVLYDRVRAAAVLDDLLQIGPDGLGDLIDLAPCFPVETRGTQDGLELVHQLRGEIGEVVDEVERVLDLVCYARGELPESRQLLGLDESVLRSAQLFERLAEFASARF